MKLAASLAMGCLFLASPVLASVDPAPVVAAERAFAADGLSMGIRDSFLKHAATDAIVFQPGPVRVHDAFPGSPADSGGPPLVWWPLWAGISRSGDLGFTTGPFTFNGRPGGYYFTVWKRQANGGWKWIYDGGPASDPVGAAPQGSPVNYLPLSTARAGSAKRAVAQVQVLEHQLNGAADLTAAYLAVMAPEGRVAGSRTAPENTPAGQARELALRPAGLTLSARSAVSAQAGDLVWTWGDAAWTKDSQARMGHYVRIWQDRKGGWKLIYDALLPAPPKAAG